jgi:F-type H+-transporting ATPase subunit delta
MTKAEIYARALFDLAVLADSVDETDEGVAAAAKAVRGHAGLRESLTDTGVPVEKKRDVLRDIFGENVTPEALAIVTLVVENGDADQLGDVSRTFGEIAEAERGMLVAEVTTAVPLDGGLRDALKTKLADSLSRPVTLRERVDASIVGGIVIQVAGRVLDGSVALQLDEARSELSSAHPGGES